MKVIIYYYYEVPYVYRVYLIFILVKTKYYYI
nr:MAG TPA: hypothetical protein [Caudoviricetes sp.]